MAYDSGRDVHLSLDVDIFLMMVLNPLTQLACVVLNIGKGQAQVKDERPSACINSFSPPHRASLIVNLGYFERWFHTGFVLCLAGCQVTHKI